MADFDEIVQQKYNDKEIGYGILYGTGEKALLIKTGQDGSIYGYEDKYLELACMINKKYGVSVVVSSNPYDRTDSLGQAIGIIRNKMAGVQDVYYMGNSNGAILGARFGHSHPELKKMLLINGSLMINWPQTKAGTEKFTGEKIVFVYGCGDDRGS